MSKLRKALEEYLAVRRALGFKLDAPGRLLHQFMDFAEAERVTFITRDLALRWATEPPKMSAEILGEPSECSAPVLRSTTAGSIPGPKFYPWDCCRSAFTRDLRTSIATRKSSDCLQQPNNCVHA